MTVPEFASREAAVYCRYILSSLDRLVGCLNGLDETGLNWQPPAPGTNSLYALVTHTLANAEENILGTLGGQTIARRHEEEFGARGDTPDLLDARWHALRRHVTVTLAGLTSADLDGEVVHPRRGPVTGREVLLVVARHAAEHLGQAELTRDLLRAERANTTVLREPV
jgi:hypothetical protein